MDPNPYESPREPQPQPPKLMRRAIGTGVILLLTPLAVGIAFGGSCAATNAFLSTNVFGHDYGTTAIVGYSIFLLPPAAVFIAMIWWAMHTHLRSEAKRPKKLRIR